MRRPIYPAESRYSHGMAGQQDREPIPKVILSEAKDLAGFDILLVFPIFLHPDSSLRSECASILDRVLLGIVRRGEADRRIFLADYLHEFGCRKKR